MGSIYKPDGDRAKNWHLVYRNADGKLVRRSARTKDAEKARAKLAELERDVALEKMARGLPTARIGDHRPLKGPLDERVGVLERTVSQLVDLHIAEADLLEEWLLETIEYVDGKVGGRPRGSAAGRRSRTLALGRRGASTITITRTGGHSRSPRSPPGKMTGCVPRSS